jgi:hypothetical protein
MDNNSGFGNMTIYRKFGKNFTYIEDIAWV